MSKSVPSLESLETDEYCLLVDCVIQAKGLRSHIHASERSTAPLNKDQSPFIPIRFFPSEKITKHDKFLLAFDALVLYTASGKKPLFGKIIHGSEQRTIKVELVELLETIKVIVSQLMTQQTGSITPHLILNKHCSECEFQPQCRKIAVEKDECLLRA